MKSPEQESFNPEQEKRGSNVKIVLHLMRHGERDKEGQLLDLGRQITKQKANESRMTSNDFDAVKAIGSQADSKEGQMGRSLETADIYAHTIAGDEAFRTREEKLLDYHSIISPRPYDHLKIYNANLPDNFNDLEGEDRILAAKKAQTAIVDHLMSLDSPEALTYKKEIAGSYAFVITHYEEMAKRLNPDSRVLLPAGTHGGNMELILQQALVREDAEGHKTIGFNNLSEIGGDIDPSEGFDVAIETDENGDQKPLKVVFYGSSRPQGNLYLDREIVSELARNYQQLHRNS